MRSRTTRRSFLALTSAQALALLLAACTRNANSSTPQPTQPTEPASATTAPPSIAPTSRPAAQVTPTARATSVAAATASRTASPAVGSPGAATSSPARATAGASPVAQSPLNFEVREYLVPRGSTPHDVAPAPDGSIWYTGQRAGELGRLDPATGAIRQVKLGQGSAPHGVIVGPDGAAWVTDGGLNAIVRVDPVTERVQRFSLPTSRANANLNTAVFDRSGTLWFTGQDGIYGSLNPAAGVVRVFSAPRGTGPYGITVTPDGTIYYASLAASYVGRIDPKTSQATVLEPPTRAQGARRVWADSRGRVWVSEWNVGQVAVYDPAANSWREWKLPGEKPQAYAVYVDNRDIVWLTDFPNNAIIRFDPATETFQSIALPSPDASVRQLLGRPGEVWGAESSVDRLIVVRAKP